MSEKLSDELREAAYAFYSLLYNDEELVRCVTDMIYGYLCKNIECLGYIDTIIIQDYHDIDPNIVEKILESKEMSRIVEVQWPYFINIKPSIEVVRRHRGSDVQFDVYEEHVDKLLKTLFIKDADYPIVRVYISCRTVHVKRFQSILAEILFAE